jgi:putative transposase
VETARCSVLIASSFDLSQRGFSIVSSVPSALAIVSKVSIPQSKAAACEPAFRLIASGVTGKIGRQRHDFYHQLSAQLVKRFALLGTEALAIQKMSRRPKAKPNPDKPGEALPNGAKQKAGLNRGILDAAPSMLLGMLRTKAAEAASVFAFANTRKVKPTQRCHRCGILVKKTLKDRVHRCSCGCTCGRDENAAKTLLRWLLEGDFWSGTGQMGSAYAGWPLETPPIAA